MPSLLDTEVSVLTLALTGGGYEQLLEHRIRAEHFRDSDNLRVYEWIVEHYQEHGVSPGLDALRANYPTWELTKPTERIDYYAGRLAERHRHDLLHVAMNEARDAMDDRAPDEAREILAEALRAIDDTAISTNNVDLTVTMDDRIEAYREWAAGGGALRGITTGYRTIDRATRGIQPGQFIVIVGDQKSGKSAVLQDICNTMNEAGNKGLLYSFEMGYEDVGARHDAFRAGINYGKLLDGRTDREMVMKLRKASRRAKDGHELILIEDELATTTVSHIAAAIKREKPDFVAIDGMYFIEDEYGEAPNSDKALGHISRGLRRIIRETKVPIIGTTQALHRRIGSKGISEKSVGYTTVFNQDCHVMLGLQPKDNGDVELRVLLSRSGPKSMAVLSIDWDRGRISERDVDDTDDEGESDGEPQSARASF